MIYIFNNNKFKQRNYKNAEELIKGLLNTQSIVSKLNENDEWNGTFKVENAEEFDKRLSKGKDVYCWIQPYIPGYCDGDMIYWFKTEGECEESYDNFGLEI